jgi:isoaspartyl peptidase/L-asparaginase-like protein (Ntn-hydrolase superfamily)
VNGVALALHGGAGALRPDRFAAGEEAALRRALAECLDEARAALAAGAAALDVVVRAVTRLEDDPGFNAGRGSALTSDGRVEMDASLMDGRTRAAGAVACVTRVANPIAAARLVMERTPHVLLVGEAADRFALAHAAREADPGSLVTDARRAELARLREGRAAVAPGGTVGAVARDARGHLAAATSTGGMTGQLPGRVGDSASIGAGTWADDATCAVSGTGHGEAFVRCALAHEIDALVRLRGLALGDACDAALARVSELGSRGGCIAVGREGGPVLRFDTEGMLRAWLDPAGRPRVALYAAE